MKTAPSSPRPSSPRGPRPGQLSDLQRSQRQASREAIVLALRRLLDRALFDDIAIEDILGEAGVSRATFYRHFKTKREVAIALNDMTMQGAIGHFRGLSIIRERDGMVRWVKQLIAIYRRNGGASALIMMLGASDAGFHRRQRADRMRLVEMLAQADPALAGALGDSPEAAAFAARIDLWLMMLDRICVEIAVHRRLPHADAYIEEIAAQWMALVDTA